MAQAIRRTNIAAVQRRRREKPIRTFVWKAMNTAMGFFFIAAALLIPFALHLLRPEIKQVLTSISQFFS